MSTAYWAILNNLFRFGLHVNHFFGPAFALASAVTNSLEGRPPVYTKLELNLTCFYNIVLLFHTKDKNMKPDQFPGDIQDYLLPKPEGRMSYECLGCKSEFGIDRLLYTCPDCGGVLMLQDKNFSRFSDVKGPFWR
jgi:DNA-directed RNA polymerase subunit RPC12/RpoP